jgi:cell division protein FtsI/penicillin-binding protein 2
MALRSTASISMGQEVALTPLQLARIAAAVANGGLLVTPRLVTGVEYSGGSAQKIPRKAPVRALSEETARKIRHILVGAVERGTGTRAAVPGFVVGGKTGTAQISWSALGIKTSGYSDKTAQSFAGYAPAYNQQFLILVKLQNPQTKTAEYSALPIFHELAKYIIDYLAIPPDYEVE